MTQPAPPAPQPQAKPRRSCFFYGCLGIMVMFLVVIVAGYFGFRYAVERFTDDKPLPLPRTQFTVEQLQRLQARVISYTSAVEDNKPVDPLVLTADEANALIQTDPNWAFLKDHLYVTFRSNLLDAQFSVPVEQLGSSRLRGRYLNARGTFSVEFHGGELHVLVQTLSAKGRPVPEMFMQHIRSRNFALTFTNEPSGPTLERVKDIRIEGDKLVIVPKPGP